MALYKFFKILYCIVLTDVYRPHGIHVAPRAFVTFVKERLKCLLLLFKRSITLCKQQLLVLCCTACRLHSRQSFAINQIIGSTCVSTTTTAQLQQQQ